MGALVLMWLRAGGLVGQAMALGGAIFALVVLRRRVGLDVDRARDRVLILTAAGGALVAAAQFAALAGLSATFADEAGWPLRAVLGSTAGTVGSIRIAAAILVALAAHAVRRAPPGRVGWAVLLVGAAAALPVTGALVSHATGSMDGTPWLVALAALHQAAASAWVGGLLAAIAVAARADAGAAASWLRRFSAVAVISVAALAVSGVGLSLEYVASAGAAVGTSYGAMVLAKVALFAALLAMAWLNHRGVRGQPAGGAAAPGVDGMVVVRRRVEVEGGLAVVALFLAASIASTPPAIDVGAQQATAEEIARVLTPRWPRLEGPSLAELSATSPLGDPDAPRTPEQTAWSEYSHNVSGLFILAMGLLATIEATGRAPWARHWPLLIVALTLFVGWSLDPEGWQTGRVGFWEHLLSPEVVQHRLMLLLTALFGLAEWRIRTARGAASPWRYVFPVVCVASGTLLLTHVHEVGNAKAAFLMEILHLPLGMLLLVAGWQRWLELRLPPALGVRHGRLWGPALALFGLLLVFYREG